MWKSLVTSKVLSPNDILFKVALDSNFLFLAINLHFFLSVTVFFRVLFFAPWRRSCYWCSANECWDWPYWGKVGSWGNLCGDASIGKWERPFRLVPNWGNRPTLGTCISESRAGSHLWFSGPHPPSQAFSEQGLRSLHQRQPSNWAMMPLGEGASDQCAAAHPPSLPPSASRVKSGVSCPSLWNTGLSIRGRSE